MCCESPIENYSTRTTLLYRLFPSILQQIGLSIANFPVGDSLIPEPTEFLYLG
jgi:hypothetical protein